MAGKPTPRLVLVTVGATAPFPALIHAVLEPLVKETLSRLGYRRLRIQHGLNPQNWGGTPEGQELLKKLGNSYKKSDDEEATAITVSGFDFVESLGAEMAQADLVISHAGELGGGSGWIGGPG